MKNLFEIAKLELINYDGVFKLINCKVEDCVDNIDDEEWCYKVASATYHDEKRNNTLYLSEIRYEGEEMEDISVVVNAISNEAYLYLINVLNTNENISVYWSQIYETTSDYTIVYDKYGKDCLYDEKYLKELMEKESGYKYKLIKNGKIEKITPEMMGK